MTLARRLRGPRRKPRQLGEADSWRMCGAVPGFDRWQRIFKRESHMTHGGRPAAAPGCTGLSAARKNTLIIECQGLVERLHAPIINSEDETERRVALASMSAIKPADFANCQNRNISVCRG